MERSWFIRMRHGIGHGPVPSQNYRPGHAMCPSAALEVLPNRMRYWTVAAAVKLETWRNKLSETAQVLPFLLPGPRRRSFF